MRILNAIKRLKRAYKYLEEGGRTEKTRAARGLWSLLLPGIMTIFALVCSGCNKKQEPITGRPAEFTLNWSSTNLPTSWNAGVDPVFRVGILCNPLKYPSDSLELKLFMKFGSTTRVGNFIIGPTTSFPVTTIYLDLGGNLNSVTANAEFWVRARIGGNGSYKDSLDTPHKILTFTPHSTPSRVKGVEYDHQVSYNIFGDAPSATARLDEAFTVADTRFNIIFDNTSLNGTALANEDIMADSNLDIKFQMANYVVRYRQYQPSSNEPVYPMYLVGVQNLLVNGQNPGVAAMTLEGPDTVLLFRQIRSSFLFLQHIRSFQFGYGVTTDQFASKTVVHEFGHQRGALSHASPPDPNDPTYLPRQHNSPFCVMNQNMGWVQDAFNDNDDNFSNNINGAFLNFTYNPFFCKESVDSLLVPTW